MAERIGDWFQTVSGVKFYPLDPRAEDIDIGDIAHGLAHQCRFAGHVRRFYSVAQHSVLVSRILPAELALVGLLHDAAEAYTGDLIRPMKLALREQTPAFDAIEQRIEFLIAEVFGLPFPWPPEVKHADNVLLATERRDLLPVQREWSLREAPLADVIRPWGPREARTHFMSRFVALTSRGPA